MGRGKLESGSSDPIEILTKRYGRAVIQPQADIRWLSTGILELDHFISNKPDEGGLPRGRVVELYGPESCGKSTLALQIAGFVLKSGEMVVWDDMERAFTASYAKRFGVSEEFGKLLVAQPATIETAMDIIQTSAPFANGGLSVIDSLAAGVPKFVADKAISDEKGAGVGSVSRSVGNTLGRLLDPLSQYDHTMLVINQMRVKFEANFAVGETTSGGWTLRHLASLRLRIRRKGVKEKQWHGRPVHVLECQMKITKTKLADNEGAEIDLWVVPQMGVRVAKPRTILSEG